DLAGVGEQARVRVIVGESVDIVIERVRPRRGENTGLTPARAEALTPLPRFGDPLARPDHERADESAEPLRQTDREHIGDVAVLAQRYAARDVRDPDPRSIHVHVARDRKSTRLNSSHVSISYDALCLKKKDKRIRKT